MSDNETLNEQRDAQKDLTSQNKTEKRLPFNISLPFEFNLTAIIRQIVTAAGKLPPILRYPLLVIVAILGIGIGPLLVLNPADRLYGLIIIAIVVVAMVLVFAYAMREYISPLPIPPKSNGGITPPPPSLPNEYITLIIHVRDENKPIAEAKVTVTGFTSDDGKTDEHGDWKYVYPSRDIKRDIKISARKKIKGEIWADGTATALTGEDGRVELHLLPESIRRLPEPDSSQPIPAPAVITIGILGLVVFGLLGLRGWSNFNSFVLLPRDARGHNEEVLIEPRNPITLGGHNSDRLPTHRVRDDIYLTPYYLDIYEVTNAEYRLCVQAGVCDLPRERSQTDLPEVVWAGFRIGGDDLPVTQVFAFDAYNYCNWVGKRLPDVAELEYAARGEIHRSYPWGEDNPTTSLINMIIPADLSDSGVLIPSAGRAVPVNDSRYLSGRTRDTGIAHLIGNVAEWTRTPATQVCQNNIYDCGDTWDGTNNIPAVYLYGDSWYGEVSPSTASYVSEWAMDETNYDIGFRCARTK